MNRKLFFLYINLIILIAFTVTNLCAQNQNMSLGLRTVVIDPGHGGKDPGALGKTRKTDEKHIVLSVSKSLGSMIQAAYPDVKVVYTRSTDVFLELKERAYVAKRNKADLFISIHCNSVPNSRAYGAAAYILGPKSTRNPKNTTDYFEQSQSVAQRENSVMLLEDDYKTSYQDFDSSAPESVISNNLLWMANYENSLLFAAEYDAYIHKAPYRESNYTGIHQDVFYLLWATNMPSALLEIGFLSNPSDYAVMSTADGQYKIAQSIFNAFCNYKTKFDASVGAIVTHPLKEEKQSKQVSSPTDVKTSISSYYGIQIMGLGRLLKSNDPALKGLEVQAVKAEGSNIYKYVCGKHDSVKDASASLADVRKKFPEAFLVKVTENKVELVK